MEEQPFACACQRRTEGGVSPILPFAWIAFATLDGVPVWPLVGHVSGDRLVPEAGRGCSLTGFAGSFLTARRTRPRRGGCTPGLRLTGRHWEWGSISARRGSLDASSATTRKWAPRPTSAPWFEAPS